MEQVLPGIIERYAPYLSILGVNVSFPQGLALYRAAVEQFAIPEGRLGVPALIVGDQVLVGKLEIPDKFPELIEQGLAGGGIAYPAIPGLETALAAAKSAKGSYDSEAWAAMLTRDSLSPAPSGVWQKFAQDPAGNSLAVAILAGMSITLALAVIRILRGATPRPAPAWLFPTLALGGLAISLYLGYVAIFQTDAVCGPVGHCNVVQHSPYSTMILGIPNGILGAGGYAAILLLWLSAARLPADPRKLPVLLLWGVTLAAMLYSIFLTFLEPFVIGASCIWCLTSAAIIAALLWLSNDALLKSWFAPSSGG